MMRNIIIAVLTAAVIGLGFDSITLHADNADLRQQAKGRTAAIELHRQVINDQTQRIRKLEGTVRDQAATIKHYFIGLQAEQPSRGLARPLMMEVTAYTADDWPNNPAYGITANGHRLSNADAWRVAAADPRYYPPGSQMYVAGVGVVTIKDTGSDVKGPHRLDIFVGMSDVAVANAWGRQKVPVRILGRVDR
jgi:3D (Asp-Asp-Asp) domain-containing protein